MVQAASGTAGTGTGTGTGGRPTVVTIKHSGSLVTLSWDGGWAAKNSVANEFTAGGWRWERVREEGSLGCCAPDRPLTRVTSSTP